MSPENSRLRDLTKRAGRVIGSTVLVAGGFWSAGCSSDKENQKDIDGIYPSVEESYKEVDEDLARKVSYERYDCAVKELNPSSSDQRIEVLINIEENKKLAKLALENQISTGLYVNVGFVKEYKDNKSEFSIPIHPNETEVPVKLRNENQASDGRVKVDKNGNFGATLTPENDKDPKLLYLNVLSESNSNLYLAKKLCGVIAKDGVNKSTKEGLKRFDNIKMTISRTEAPETGNV